MSVTAPAPPVRPGVAHGLRIALATADPGLGRLRSATTTVAVLAVTAAVVLGGAALAGGPVTAAVTGVVVAFVTGIAGRDQPFREHAVLTGGAALAAAVVAVVSALVGGAATPAGITVFVALGVIVVFLQRLGPRGFAPGMAGFVTFLATSLTGLTVAALPLAIGGALLAALTVIATRRLLRTRRPERAARHALDAVEARAGLALLALGDVVRDGGSDRTRQRARRRLAALRRTTAVADDRLAESDADVLPGFDDRVLGVRVFDLRLGLEHLATLLTPDRLTGARPGLADLLDDVGRTLLAPRELPGRWDRVAVRLDEEPVPGEERLHRTLARVVEEWRRPPHHPTEETVPDDGSGATGPAGPPVSDTVRRAVQIALAITAAALVGQWVSSMQWFFAVVIAFVVFVSSSSRGGVLSEGWQRTLGTLLGVVVGVGLAALLDGAVVPTVVLLAVCLFGALYVVGLSSTALMVFITVGIALVYGLIGRFTVDVLLLRLAETAVGAGIGIAVSFVVLPTRTRTTFADATARFLRALRAVLDEAVDVLASQRGTAPVVQTVDEGVARELRDAHAGVETAAGPLTDGLAGMLDRTGHRDALRVLGSIDHHARLLLHLARRQGTVGDEEAGAVLRAAAEHVGGRVDAVADLLDRQTRSPEVPDDDVDEHGRVLGALDAAARDASTTAGDATDAPDSQQLAGGDVLEAVGGRLRAIDRALTEIADRHR